MKNTKQGFIIPLLIIIIAALAIGGGVYEYQKNKEANTGSPISFAFSGVTTGKFSITVNPDESGIKEELVHELNSNSPDSNVSTNFPARIFDYKNLNESIKAVPTLSYKGGCVLPILASEIKLTYEGKEYNMTCALDTSAYKKLSDSIDSIVIKAQNK